MNRPLRGAGASEGFWAAAAVAGPGVEVIDMAGVVGDLAALTGEV